MADLIGLGFNLLERRKAGGKACGGIVAAASGVMRQLFKKANQEYHAEVHVLCRLVCEAGP